MGSRSLGRDSGGGITLASAARITGCHVSSTQNEFGYVVRAYENEQLIAEAAARELKVAINQVVEIVYRKRKMEVFEECGWRCSECGEVKALECDHIVPRSKGRSDLKDNLRPLCSECHARKHRGI